MLIAECLDDDEGLDSIRLGTGCCGCDVGDHGKICCDADNLKVNARAVLGAVVLQLWDCARLCNPMLSSNG